MILVSPEQIAAVMALRPVPHSVAELDEQVRVGLPKSALKEGVEHATRSAEERRALLSRIVPEATFKRRRDRLSPDESDKQSGSRASWRPRNTYGTARTTRENFLMRRIPCSRDAATRRGTHGTGRPAGRRTPVDTLLRSPGVRQHEKEKPSATHP